MRHPILVISLIPAIALLAACGGREGRAIDACERAIAERITDKPFRIDRKHMASNTTREGEDVYRVQSTIVFDPGLPREETQSFDCRARFTADRRDPDVISLTFVW